MPFTFSHPALVLPLNYLPKKWFSLTALIIGSMLPDLEAFLRFKSEKNVGHSWDALFWFCLPLGLVIATLFHQVVKKPLVYNLPSFLQKRFLRYTQFNWIAFVKKNVLVVLLSFLIGGASHLLWDSFSHYEGVLLQLNPDWDRNTTVFGYSIEIVYVVQYVNTILGLLIILFAVGQLPAEKMVPAQQNKLLYWTGVLCIALVIFLVRWLVLDTFKIDDVIVSGMMAVMTGVFFTSLIFYKRYPHKNSLEGT